MQGSLACSTVDDVLDCGDRPPAGAFADIRMRLVAALRRSIASAAVLLAADAAFAATPAVPVPAASAPSPVLSDACPAQLPVSQTVAEPIAGWTPMNQQGSYPFQRVALHPGPPVDGDLIVPTFEYRGQAGLHDGWDLPHREGGYWLTCAYVNTTATVTRKLAADVDFCQADYDGRFMTLVVRHWSCGVKRTMPASAWAKPAAKAVKPAAKAATTKRSE